MALMTRHSAHDDIKDSNLDTTFAFNPLPLDIKTPINVHNLAQPNKLPNCN